MANKAEGEVPENQEAVNDDLKNKRKLKLELYRLPWKIKENEVLWKYIERFQRTRQLKMKNDDLNNYVKWFENETKDLKFGAPGEDEEKTLSFLGLLPASQFYKKVTDSLISTTEKLTADVAANFIKVAGDKNTLGAGEQTDPLVSFAETSQVSTAKVADDKLKIRKLKLELYRLALKMENNEGLQNYSKRFKEETDKILREVGVQKKEGEVGVQKEEEEITLLFLALLPDAYKANTESLISNEGALTLDKATKALEAT